MVDKLFVAHFLNNAGEDVWQIVDRENWIVLSSVGSRDRVLTALVALIKRYKTSTRLNKTIGHLSENFSMKEDEVEIYRRLYEDYLEDTDLVEVFTSLINEGVKEERANIQTPLKRTLKVKLLRG